MSTPHENEMVLRAFFSLVDLGSLEEIERLLTVIEEMLHDSSISERSVLEDIQNVLNRQRRRY